jgi:hypothetical protein
LGALGALANLAAGARHPAAVVGVWEGVVRVWRAQPIMSGTAMFLVIWFYLILVGGLLGRYHGRAAIERGKMQSVSVQSVALPPGSRNWMFVTKTDAGDVVFYDRDGGAAYVVKEGAPLLFEPFAAK